MTRTATVALLFAAMLLVACDKKGQIPTPQVAPADAVGMAASAAALAQQERDEFVAATRQDLAVLKDQVAAMKDKALRLKAEARIARDAQIAKIDGEAQVLEEKIATLQAATSQTWQALKADVSQALERLRQMIDASGQG